MTVFNGSELILTANKGLSLVKDLREGDLLWSSESNTCSILKITNHHDQVIRLRTIIGQDIYYSLDDEIVVFQTNINKLRKFLVSDYIKSSNYIKHNCKLKIQDIDFTNVKDPSIDPYFLGLFLGDGNISDTIGITSKDYEVINYVYDFARNNNLRVSPSGKKSCKTYRICGLEKKNNPLLSSMRNYGLGFSRASTKFIPDEFLFNSKSNRLKLLAGLLDSDGHKHRNNNYDYITKSEKLAMDISILCRSLGFRVNISLCSKKAQNGFTGQYFRLGISCHDNIIPNLIARKQSQKRLKVNSPSNVGFFMEEISYKNFIKIQTNSSNYIDHNFYLSA